MAKEQSKRDAAAAAGKAAVGGTFKLIVWVVLIAAAFAFGVLIYMRKSEYKLRSGY